MLVERLQPVLSALAGPYELVLVNDGSPDRSWEIIEQLAAKHSWVRGIRLMRNYGQHNALLCGIRAARYEIIATMDDDLQHPPEELPKLLAELNRGFEVVYGAPEKEQHGLWHQLPCFGYRARVRGAGTASLVRARAARGPAPGGTPPPTR